MANFRLLMVFFAAAAMGWGSVVAEDATAQSGAVSGSVRDKRHLRKRKLCIKYGICEGIGGGYGGFQGGYVQGGHQGGYQGGYGQPPINIAISQSQSSANEGGGGHAHGYYPNNYQYNGGYPNHGGYQGGYGAQGGYGQQGGPGYFGNGQGAYNNQFNGNYYGPVGPHGPNVGGGYGFQKPGFGPFFDEGADEEGNKPEHNEHEGDDIPQGGGGYNDYNQGQGYHGHGQGQENFAVAGAFALAGRKNH